MKIRQLIFRNLRYYRRPYLAVLAGVIVSTAVLTGALLVGDSVKGTLGRLTELRLGTTYWAVQPADRFFRSELADELSQKLEHPVVPGMLLTGIGVNPLTGNRVQDIQIAGIDRNFTTLWKTPVVVPETDEVVISENLATKLELQIGDPLLIRLPRVAKTPQNAPFVSDKTPPVSLRLTISAIAGEEAMGRFSLKSNQQAPFNAFVSLTQLSARVGLPGSANFLLVPEKEKDTITLTHLEDVLRNTWQMADAGIRLAPLDENGLTQLTTDRIFFDDQTADAVRDAFPDARPVLTYLANSLVFNGNETPYSFVTAITDGILPVQPPPGKILVTDWLAADLGIQPGDSLTMTYFVMGPLRKLEEERSRFQVSGMIPLTSVPFGESFMPEFPGIADAGQCSSWETGTPVNLDRIREKDEAYWNRFRGTPKAFISMEDGKRLWNNSFGTVTSFRYVQKPGDQKTLLMNALDPSWHQMDFQPVREQGQYAAANSTDFSGLFLSLSFFLIVSSLLLTAMLFSLHAQTRIPEFGVLSGLGFRERLIRGLLFSEALLVAIPGVVLGSAGGILYNKLILYGLNTLWQDAVRTSMLKMEVHVSTLALGAACGFLLALSVLYLSLRGQMRQMISVRVKDTIPVKVAGMRRKKVAWAIVGTFLVTCSVGLLVFLLAEKSTLNATLFLLAGALMLMGGIALLYAGIIWRAEKPLGRRAGLLLTVVRLGSLKRARSISAIILLALGTFTIVITGANRKTFYGTEGERTSGTGGFLLWAETTMPLQYDLNSDEGTSHFALEEEPLLRNVRFSQLYRRDGNDASCLNLNLVPQPMILGVPAEDFDSMGVFRLAAALPGVDMKHPWKVLEGELSPDVIPAFADQTVITWGLEKQVGDTLVYTDELGKEFLVRLMGGLENSIFQGYILISDSLLLRRYPSINGTNILLADGPIDGRDEIAGRLEELFLDEGMRITPASVRLAEFNSVENTYLTIFMLLGALGVLIGTIGFGIILWRNNLERSNEMALYFAIGFRKQFIRTLLMTEYFLILLSGMTLGIVGAAAGILPSWISPAYRMPEGFLAIILALIWISGTLWIYFPVRELLKRNP
ncbi:MAG: FtsX-like permease family protein [Bacteroidales bacterium]|nr:FtsX-like permease family protein [Bacteroidales bacterium]